MFLPGMVLKVVVLTAFDASDSDTAVSVTKFMLRVLELCNFMYHFDDLM